MSWRLYIFHFSFLICNRAFWKNTRRINFCSRRSDVRFDVAFDRRFFAGGNYDGRVSFRRFNVRTGFGHAIRSIHALERFPFFVVSLQSRFRASLALVARTRFRHAVSSRLFLRSRNFVRFFGVLSRGNLEKRRAAESGASASVVGNVRRSGAPRNGQFRAVNDFSRTLARRSQPHFYGHCRNFYQNRQS